MAAMTSTSTRRDGFFGLLDSGPTPLGRYHPAAMSPPPLIAPGLVVLSVGIVALLSFGPRYRVGRLLAATPKVTVAEALELARAGRPRYVRVDGRIDSEEDFPDEHHRPLVYRRQRLQLRKG